MGDKASSGLSIAQVIGGALASMSAALIASKFGVAGTIIGAAVTSVTVTIGSVLYRRSIEGAQERVRSRYRRPLDESNTEPALRSSPRRRLALGAVAGGTVLVFVVAMGGLTAFEAIARTSAARLMGQSSSDARTTVGAVIQNVAGDGSGQNSPMPDPSESAVPDDADPAATPADIGPSPTPAGEPAPGSEKPAATEPATNPSDVPVVETPVPVELSDPTESPAISPAEPAN